MSAWSVCSTFDPVSNFLRTVWRVGRRRVRRVRSLLEGRLVAVAGDAGGVADRVRGSHRHRPVSRTASCAAEEHRERGERHHAGCGEPQVPWSRIERAASLVHRRASHKCSGVPSYALGSGNGTERFAVIDSESERRESASTCTSRRDTQCCGPSPPCSSAPARAGGRGRCGERGPRASRGGDGSSARPSRVSMSSRALLGMTSRAGDDRPG